MNPTRLLAISSLVLVLGCGSEPDPAGPRMEAAPGPKAAGITVTSADPAYGHKGEVQKQIRIKGSGFQPGDQAAWQRDGVTDPKVQVTSTAFVSSSELIATVNIASDATLAFYDIAVAGSGRKGGIGTMLFEVTQAIEVPGSIIVHAVNEAGEMVGGDFPGFVYSESSGLTALTPFGRAQGISEDGLSITGGSGVVDGGPRFTTLWTRSGSAWLSSYLPRDPLASEGRARAMGSDPLSGSAAIIGGLEDYYGKTPKGNRREPRLWILSGSAWQRVVLPGEGTAGLGYVNDVTINGVAVGITAANGKALIWERTGTGTWITALVGPASSEAYEVNTAGTIVVGKVSDQAIYWRKAGGVWTGPFQLGACRRAVAINDQDQIVADSCPRSSRTTGPAIFPPPYSTSTMQFLGGLGSLSEAYVSGISRDGRWVVGEAPTKTQGVVGVYWKLY